MNQPLAGEKLYFSATYNLTVVCRNPNRPMEASYEDNKYSVQNNYKLIGDWLWLNDAYNPNTQRAVVYNAMPFLFGGVKPERGKDKDYIISDLADDEKNDILHCKREHLAVGDIVLHPVSGVTEVTADHRWLHPIEDQGYYRFRIIGGSKWDAFKPKQGRESVAEWSAGHNCWHWKD